MSSNAIAWCMRQYLDNQTDWAILMRICDHYNDLTKCAYPSQDRLAGQTKKCRETVNRHIQRLVDMGYIEIDKTPNKVNKYRLPLLEMDVTKLSQPDLDVTKTSHEDIIYNISDNIIDDITLSTKKSNNYTVDNGDTASVSPREKLWNIYLPWFQKQKSSIKNHRSFLARLINEASGNKKANHGKACQELCRVFEHCKDNLKYNLSEYLMASAKGIAQTSGQTKKELNRQAKDMIEDWIDRIYKKSMTDDRLVGEDYDKIRKAFEDAWVHGTTEIYKDKNNKPFTVRGLREYFLIL